MFLLIGAGHSNADIAAGAFIAGGAMKTHITRLLLKLGPREHGQVVIFAFENGLR